MIRGMLRSINEMRCMVQMLLLSVNTSVLDVRQGIAKSTVVSTESHNLPTPALTPLNPCS